MRNEAAHIERVVRAMAAQDLAPTDWIVIDDRSDDGTLEILRGLEHDVPFLTVAEHRPTEPARSAPDRLADAAEVRNFYAGLGCAPEPLTAYTHVMKLDGDIQLPPEYLREMMARFAADPALGLVGGVLVEPGEDGSMRPIRIPRQYVHGALKLYTVECFTAIGGISEQLGWDTIDLTRARMHGFRTANVPEVVSVHLRPLASADGRLRGRARHGECAWVTHIPPEWVALRALKVATWKPRGLSGLWYLFGYLRAAIRRVPRVQDDAYRTFARREVRARILARARSPLRRREQAGPRRRVAADGS